VAGVGVISSVESQEVPVSDCLTGSPGRIHNHKEKAGNFSGFVATPRADTPKHAPADDWLFLDSPNFPWNMATCSIGYRGDRVRNGLVGEALEPHPVREGFRCDRTLPSERK
jgi:hypothetical protein